MFVPGTVESRKNSWERIYHSNDYFHTVWWKKGSRYEERKQEIKVCKWIYGEHVIEHALWCSGTVWCIG